MASGWDKEPGPGNDYASSVSSRNWIATAVFLLIVIVGIIGATAALAEEGRSFGGGVMASKCGHLVEGMTDSVSVGRHPLAFAMLSWAEGYITAINVESVSKGGKGFDLNSLTGAEIWASIYGFCKRNPDEFGFAAVIDTMKKLKASD